jgi:hypothetical protein
MKLVRMIKMCLNESYITDRIGEGMPDQFPIKSSLTQSDALLRLLCIFWFSICHWEGPGKPGVAEIKWDTSASSLC